MIGFDRLIHIYDFIRPILDIAVMTFILYKAYDFISKTNGVQMFKALVIVAIAFGVFLAFNIIAAIVLGITTVAGILIGIDTNYNINSFNVSYKIKYYIEPN